MLKAATTVLLGSIGVTGLVAAATALLILSSTVDPAELTGDDFMPSHCIAPDTGAQLPDTPLLLMSSRRGSLESDATGDRHVVSQIANPEFNEGRLP